MNEEKMNIIENSITDFKKLLPEQKMFVLGFMQGVLVNQNDKKENEECQKLIG